MVQNTKRDDVAFGKRQEKVTKTDQNRAQGPPVWNRIFSELPRRENVQNQIFEYKSRNGIRKGGMRTEKHEESKFASSSSECDKNYKLNAPRNVKAGKLVHWNKIITGFEERSNDNAARLYARQMSRGSTLTLFKLAILWSNCDGAPKDCGK